MAAELFDTILSRGNVESGGVKVLTANAVRPELQASTNPVSAVANGHSADDADANGADETGADADTGVEADEAEEVDEASEAKERDKTSLQAQDLIRPMKQKDLLQMAAHCLKHWTQADTKEFEKVRSRLPKKISEWRKSPEACADAAALAASSKTLLNESQQLVEHAPKEDYVTRNFRSLSSPPQLNRAAQDGIERDAKRWWTNTVDKVASSTIDGKNGKAFNERLVASLPSHDPDISSQTADMLKPWRQKIERHIQDELKPQVQKAGTEPLRAALRDGGSLLEAAVHNAMKEAAQSWTSDESIRQAAQRLNGSTSAAALLRTIGDDAALSVRETLRPLAQTPATIPDFTSRSSSGSSSARLIARVRTDMKPLNDAIQQLTLDVNNTREELSRVRESLEASASSSSQATNSDAAIRGNISQLCGDRQFESAFEQALKLDRSSSSGDGTKSLLEWTCEQALLHSKTSTPDDFLAQQPPPFSRGLLHLSLMSALLQRAVSAGISVAQAEMNLEWVLCLENELTETGSSLREPLASAAPAMIDMLNDVLHGRAAVCSAEGPQGARQPIIQAARMALKQLELLQRHMARRT